MRGFFYPYIYFIDATFATHAQENPARLITLDTRCYIAPWRSRERNQ